MSRRRLKLLIVIIDLAAGTGTFTRSLAGGLRRLYPEEFEVSLLTLRPQSLFDTDRAPFDHVHTLNSGVHDDWRRLYELPLAVHRLRQFIANSRPDLIFAVHTFSNVVCSLATDEIPIILSDHLNMSAWLKRTQFGWLTASLMRRAYKGRLIVGASKSLVDDSIHHFGAARGVVIPNGIDIAHVQNEANFESPLTAVNSPYLIAVGRLTPQKDFATLLRAFAIARQAGLSEGLIIVGNGGERDRLESFARELRIEKYVEFTGRKTNPFPLIRGARCLVLSSIWEGFAYVPIEAMALGVPCICTDCPSGPAEILGNGEYGLLAEPGNPQSLARAILELCGNEAIHERFARLAPVRAQQLSVENMVCRYRDVFLAEAVLE